MKVALYSSAFKTLLINFVFMMQAFETWSLGSVGGRSRSSSDRRSNTRSSSSRATSNSTPLKAGSILRHVILKAISSQVASASVGHVTFPLLSTCNSITNLLHILHSLYFRIVLMLVYPLALQSKLWWLLELHMDWFLYLILHKP